MLLWAPLSEENLGIFSFQYLINEALCHEDVWGSGGIAHIYIFVTMVY
jgi:hypothetical protein